MSAGRLYVSTTSFVDRSFVALLDTCAREGIDALELSTVEGFDRRQLHGARGRMRFLVHNYFPPPPLPLLVNLMAQDATALGASVEHCADAIRLSAEIGGPVYAAHAGYLADVPPSMLGNPAAQAAIPAGVLVPYDRGYRTLVASARALADTAGRLGVRFLVENHVLSPDNGAVGPRLLPMLRSGELARLAEDVAHPSFGILVDVGHLNVTASTLGFDRHAFIDEVAPHLGAFHLSDNDGMSDAHRGFGADAWFLPRLADFPDIPVTVELWKAPLDEILRVRDVVARWL